MPTYSTVIANPPEHGYHLRSARRRVIGRNGAATVAPRAEVVIRDWLDVIQVAQRSVNVPFYIHVGF